jgi:hypothetical protein
MTDICENFIYIFFSKWFPQQPPLILCQSLESPCIYVSVLYQVTLVLFIAFKLIFT